MNSTPPNWSSIMRLTALPPPPPTPTTFILAVWAAPSSSSKIIVMSPRPDSEEVLEPPSHRSQHLFPSRWFPPPRPKPATSSILLGAVEHRACRYRHPG